MRNRLRRKHFLNWQREFAVIEKNVRISRGKKKLIIKEVLKKKLIIEKFFLTPFSFYFVRDEAERAEKYATNRAPFAKWATSVNEAK